MRLPQDRILHIDTEFKNGKLNVVAEWQGELVRCKDCLNYNGNGNKCNWGMKAYDDAYCSHGHYDDGSTPILNCADGERREP